MAAKVIMIAVLICISCLPAKYQTNAALQCNIIEVPLKGSPHRYKNELVEFYLKDDSLKIQSRHVSLAFARRQQLERSLPVINHVKKQFVFKDQSNELYKVLYTRNESNSKIYLYLYIVNLKQAAPIYLFTNDPNYAP